MFRWKLPWRVRATPTGLLIERRPQTANSSPLGAEVDCCCTSTYLCITCGRVPLGYDEDPWDLEPITAARLAELRRQEYARHVASLDKLPGAIRLFRTWRLTAGGHLQAMVTEHTWVAGENTSKASSKTNAAEDSGFHGFSSLAELQKQESDWWQKSQSGEPKVVGVTRVDDWTTNGYPITRVSERRYWYVCGTMLGYGHCKLASKGGRVQKAIPEYIIEPDGSDPDFGMLVVNAAEKYGMQIVSLAQAEELQTGMVSYWKGRPIR